MPFDGLIVNRAVAAPIRRTTTPLAAEMPARATATDALALGRDPAGGAAPLASGAPPGASAEHLIADISRRLETATGLDAKRLTTFAAVVASTAADPAATAALAQAYRTPQASEGAARLASVFFDASEAGLSQLYFTAAIDDPATAAELNASFPNAMFSPAQTGASVLAAMVKEIYDPQQVIQGDKQTCGAATAQIMMVRGGPDEYIRVVTGLAFEGQARLPGGAVIYRAPDWEAGAATDQRPVTSRLLQPALMEFANGGDSYDARGDVTRAADSGQTRQGLTASEMETLVAGISGQTTERHIVKSFQNGVWSALPGTAQAEAIAQIQAMTDKGWSAPVLLSVRPDQAFGHYQVVTRMDADTVYSLNPWGREEPMSRQLFEARLVASFAQ